MLTRSLFTSSPCSSLYRGVPCSPSQTIGSLGGSPTVGCDKPPMLLLGHDSRRQQVKEVTPAIVAKKDSSLRNTLSKISPLQSELSSHKQSDPHLMGFLFFFQGCPKGLFQPDFTICILRYKVGRNTNWLVCLQSRTTLIPGQRSQQRSQIFLLLPPFSFTTSLSNTVFSYLSFLQSLFLTLVTSPSLLSIPPIGNTIITVYLKFWHLLKPSLCLSYLLHPSCWMIKLSPINSTHPTLQIPSAQNLRFALINWSSHTTDPLVFICGLLTTCLLSWHPT